MVSAYLLHVDPPSGYRNPEAMAEYATSVRVIVEAFDGHYRARHQAVQTLEGQWDPEFFTLIEFPTMTRLLQFYESEEYRPWLELRNKSGDGTIVIFQGEA
ncbi:DUF1330 domain-containing protein [Mycolicibacterium sp. XJ870]